MSRTAVKLCRSRGSGNETLLGGAVREGGDAEVVLFFFRTEPLLSPAQSGAVYERLLSSPEHHGYNWMPFSRQTPLEATQVP